MSYSFHGLGLRVSGPDEVLRAFHARFASLPEDGDGPPDLLFEVQADPLERPEHSRPVYDPPFGEVVYDDGRDLLYLQQGRLSALCEPAAGRVRYSAAWARTWRSARRASPSGSGWRYFGPRRYCSTKA